MSIELTTSQTIQLILHGFVWMNVGLFLLGPIGKGLEKIIRKRS